MSKSEALQAPVHPGEILREDFMKPLNLTVNRLALELHAPVPALVKLCTNAAGSQRRQPFDWHGTLTQMLSSGLICRISTT